MAEGWIKLDRSIFEHWIFQDAEKFRAFVDLIQLARWKDEKLLIGNEIVNIPRGSYYTSELKLAEKWGWSRKKTREYLKLLESEGMIIKKGTTKGTTLIIENYRLYQDEGTTKGTTKSFLSYRERDWSQVGQEQGKELDLSCESEGAKKGTTKDTTESVDITTLELIKGTTKGTPKEHQRNSEGYIKGTSKEHQKNNEGYTKEEREEIKEIKEGEEGKENTPSPPPLSFPTPYHEVIYNQWTETTYRTWFIDTDIEDKENQIVISVKSDFIKNIINEKFKEQLDILLGKKVIVSLKEI
jgi:biotin operon repressor